jgi:protein farnesyltransferase/geranylgeranyltransferase type-1 subunit alpha
MFAGSPKLRLTVLPRLYRAQTLQALEKPLRDEIAWLNPTALKHLKNYQIWNHRQTIIDQLGSPEGEADFIDSMLKADSKNYHVWSYRQWLVQRFDLYNDGAELAWVNKMINEDVRNNSAWNHRYFLVFGNKDKGNGPESVIVQREIEYVCPVVYPDQLANGTPVLDMGSGMKRG